VRVLSWPTSEERRGRGERDVAARRGEYGVGGALRIRRWCAACMHNDMIDR
jgi:hypothetical protein